MVFKCVCCGEKKEEENASYDDIALCDDCNDSITGVEE